MTADRRHQPDADPDFAALYETAVSKGGAMTPRMAYWLWNTGVFLADTWRDGRDDPGPLLEFLPPIARQLAHGEWYERFTNCFDALATRIASGQGDQERLAGCTGEELALHLVIDLAEAHLADGIIDTEIDTVASLPDHGPLDSDFEAMRSRLFTDHDVLMLFDPMLDGVDDPDSEISQIQRAANLHPRDWFKPFADS